jgi:glycosyltransferase involved in cell wall biosynthesis
VPATRSNAPDPEPAPGWICFSSVDWWYFNQAHSDIQLMRRIAEVRPVLFVNSIGMRMPLPGRSSGFGGRILRKAQSVLRFVQQPLPDVPGFHVYTPVILPFYGSPLMRALNTVLLRAQVRLMARRIGFDVGDAVVFLAIPTAWEVARSIEPRALLYNRSDRHSSFTEADQGYIEDLERQLFAGSDAVLYVSHALMDSERAAVGERAVFLDHGVDLERFGATSAAEPADLAAVPHPRIGFFGAIDDYTVDVELLVSVAEAHPEASLVLVGAATCSMDRLTKLPNVHWLGFRPYEQIPAYGAGFDVALMPWLSNDWIEHSNPIKLKEYLALGLPIVSTDFPEVRFYDDVVAVAADPGDFVRLVGRALAGEAVGTTDRRRGRVEDASWDRRAEELLDIGEQRAR